MNSHNRSNHDPFDILIGRYFKNWLGQYDPPDDARDSLMRLASVTIQEPSPGVGLWQQFLRHGEFWFQSLVKFFIGQNSRVFGNSMALREQDSPFYSDTTGQLFFQSFQSRMEIMRLIS